MSCECKSPLVLQGSPTASGRAAEQAAASQDTGAVRYPSLPGSASEAAHGYAAYPDVADTSHSPPVSQQTELFMDFYSDVSRYPFHEFFVAANALPGCSVIALVDCVLFGTHSALTTH